jgi:CHASE2 domain-containing sensor protein
MEWVYVAGIGFNVFGYMRFIKMLEPMNTPTLNGIKNISAIGGLIIIAIGFAVFQWWVPIFGLFLAPILISLVFSASTIARFPQIAIGLGLLLSVIGLVLA